MVKRIIIVFLGLFTLNALKAHDGDITITIVAKPTETPIIVIPNAEVAAGAQEITLADLQPTTALAAEQIAQDADSDVQETPQTPPSSPELLLSADVVKLNVVCPSIKVELRYATAKNITMQRIYPKNACCYVRPEVAMALAKVQDELAQMGYGLIVWDGYQPPHERMRIWELIHNETLISNPNKRADAHARGMAVDVTMCYLDTGRKVAMPTDFENITIKSCPSCQDLPKKAMNHRDLLMAVMTKHGFEAPTKAWWHFQLCGWDTVMPLEESFDELEQMMM